MDWPKQRVLITGGAGFIGSNLAHALRARGAHVTVLDNLDPDGGGRVLNLHGAGAETVCGDIRTATLMALFRRTTVVFNLAAQTSHVAGENEPALDLEINATAQLRLIAAAREHCPDAVVVHASTRQFYGRPDAIPVSEAHPVNPPDSNAISKFAGERYWMHERRHRPVVSLRLTNCYGPRMRIKDAKQCFLGWWLRCAMEGKPFEVWGGEQLRDLAYIDDVVGAFILAAETEACWARVFNIGGAESATLLETAGLLREEAPGASFVTKEFPPERAAIDIGSYVSDTSAFRAATGWEPHVGLADGLRRSLEWFGERTEEYT